MSSNRKEIMNDSFNPFDRIIENPDYPLARIYRESFWQGIADTYDVLVGNHYRIGENEDTHAGVLDILIFPLLSQWLMRIAFPTLKNIFYEEQPKNGAKEEKRTYVGSDGTRTTEVIYKTPAAPMPIRLMAGFIAGLLEIPRAVIGVGLTLLISPIVAVVHMVTSFKAYKLRNQVKELNIVAKEKKLGKVDDSNKKRSLSTVEVTKKLKVFLDDSKLTDISINSDKNNTYIIDENDKFEREFTLINGEETSKPAKAFRKLNIGGHKIR